MNAQEFTDKIKEFVFTQIDQVAVNTPLIGLLRPLMTRGIDKNIGKITSMLDMISDENGLIDAENLVGEMLISLSTSSPFILNVPVVGDIEFGQGCIKINIPMTTKRLVLSQLDLEKFKNLLIDKLQDNG